MSVESNTPSSLYFAVIHPCPECGEKAGTTFSRVLCACSMMHTYCAACGVQADPCWDEREEGFTVLGSCPHGVDLDREFCPQGCRV